MRERRLSNTRRFVVPSVCVDVCDVLDSGALAHHVCAPPLRPPFPLPAGTLTGIHSPAVSAASFARVTISSRVSAPDFGAVSSAIVAPVMAPSAIPNRNAIQ